MSIATIFSLQTLDRLNALAFNFEYADSFDLFQACDYSQNWMDEYAMFKRRYFRDVLLVKNIINDLEPFFYLRDGINVKRYAFELWFFSLLFCPRLTEIDDEVMVIELAKPHNILKLQKILEIASRDGYKIPRVGNHLLTIEDFEDFV